MTTLYRKYRPNNFSEIVGQEAVIRTLTGAVKYGRFGNAYLFTGPRGTGKTTIARVFAKAVNCLQPRKDNLPGEARLEPCDTCQNCSLIKENKTLDIVEIDAASHTGVDNIRQLKENINLPPSNLNYRVYIIDEVHMLSLGAFNALLKTLEEPPAHTIFILATTEAHKVPATIISRCQRFNIKPLTKQQIIQRLRQISEKEKLSIEDEALAIIAEEAVGGMRDAESMLGQIISLSSARKITVEDIEEILGISSEERVFSLLNAIDRKNLVESISTVNQLQASGHDLSVFTRQLLNKLRQLLLITVGQEELTKELTGGEKERLQQFSFSLTQILALIAFLQKSLAESQQTEIAQLPLELALVKYFLHFKFISTGSNQESLQSSRDTAVQATASKEEVVTVYKKKEKKKSESLNTEDANEINYQPDKAGNLTADTASEEERGKKIVANISINDFLQQWSAILAEIKEAHQSIYAFLSNSMPLVIKDGVVLIKTKYDFHQSTLNSPKNKLTIEKVFAKLLKAPLKVRFITAQEARAYQPESQNKEEKADKDDDAEALLYQALKEVGGKIIDSE